MPNLPSRSTSRRVDAAAASGEGRPIATRRLRSRVKREVPALLFSFLAACQAAEGENSLRKADYPREDAIVFLQAFDWPFAEVERRLPEIAEAGFTHIHVSPPQYVNEGDDWASEGKRDEWQWWRAYQPWDYRRLENYRGDADRLASLVAAARDRGLTVVADLVLNQLGSHPDLANDPKRGGYFYPPGCDPDLPLGSDSPNSCLFFENGTSLADGSTSRHFQVPRRIGAGPSENQEYEDICIAMRGQLSDSLPDLSTGRCRCGQGSDSDYDAQGNCLSQEFYDPEYQDWDGQVFEVAKAYVRRLQNLKTADGRDGGLRAFRVDAGKHMDPKFIEALFGDPEIAAKVEFAYAEVIGNDTSPQILALHLDEGRLHQMNFPLVRQMQRAFRSTGDLRHLLAQSLDTESLRTAPPGRFLNFVMNHDIASNDGGLGYRFEDENVGSAGEDYEEIFRKEMLAYAYVFAQSGIPYVYSELAEATPSTQGYRPAASYVNFHLNAQLKAMIAFQKATFKEIAEVVSSLSGSDRDHLALRRGKGLLLLNKGQGAWQVQGPSGLPPGRYRDLLGGGEVRVSAEGRLETELPASSAQMLLPIGERAFSSKH